MKKILLSILQLGVTIALLFWVFHDPVKRAQMAGALRVADFRWLIGGVIAYVIVELAAALRWQILLNVQGIYLKFGRIFRLFFIGMFYNQFLPGGTGGDIVKSYLLLKETPGKKPGALLAVLFDRMVGLLALILITGTLVVLRLSWLAQTPQTRPYLWTLLLVMGGAGLALLTSFAISGLNLLHFLPRQFPGREKLIELSAAYQLYAHHWTGTVLAFGASLVAHLGTFAMFLCVAYAFGQRVPLVNFFAVMPIERTISSLPISFGGLGMRELVLQVMLNGLCNVPIAVARLIGLMAFSIILLCSFPGGIIYLLYKPSVETRHVKLREMETEVATLEHEIGQTE